MVAKLSAPERGVYAASLSLLSQVSLNSNLVGSFTLKRPEGRAPTNRQLQDAPGLGGIGRIRKNFVVVDGITDYVVTTGATANRPRPLNLNCMN